MTVLGLALHTHCWHWAVWREGKAFSRGREKLRVADRVHAWQMQRFLLAWQFQEWLLALVDQEDVNLVALAPVKESNLEHQCLLGALVCVGAVYEVPVACPTLGELEVAGLVPQGRGNHRLAGPALAAAVARLPMMQPRVAPPDMLS